MTAYAVKVFRRYTSKPQEEIFQKGIDKFL